MSIFNKKTTEIKKENPTKKATGKTGWTREQLLSIKDTGYTGTLLHSMAPDAEMENLGYEREL